MKKKFKDTKVGKFLKEKAPKILDKVADFLPDKGALGVVKNLIDQDNELTPQDKETALKLLEMDLKEMEEVSNRWQYDMTSDSWLSKNVRPLVLIWLVVLMTMFTGFDSIENWSFEVKEVWVKLWEGVLITVIFAYFGSRGVEKWRKMK